MPEARPARTAPHAPQQIRRDAYRPVQRVGAARGDEGVEGVVLHRNHAVLARPPRTRTATTGRPRRTRTPSRRLRTRLRRRRNRVMPPVSDTPRCGQRTRPPSGPRQRQGTASTPSGRRYCFSGRHHRQTHPTVGKVTPQPRQLPHCAPSSTWGSRLDGDGDDPDHPPSTMRSVSLAAGEPQVMDAPRPSGHRRPPRA